MMMPVVKRRDAFYQGIWLAAAASIGLPAETVGGSTVEIRLGDEVLRMSRGATSLESTEAFEKAGDKPQIHQLLAARGIPVPDHPVTTLATLNEALPFVLKTPGCVVEPALDGSGGRGVTTNVRTAVDLRRSAIAAAAPAGRASRSSRGSNRSGLARLTAKLAELAALPLLVEEQVAGANYRLLLLDGRLVDAVERAQPTIVGDGRHSVRALIERANAARATVVIERGGPSITRDADLMATLAQQGLRLSPVPALGRSVTLKIAVNDGAIADVAPAADRLCASIVEDAATVVGTGLVGVDVITTDPSVPLTRSGGRVLEINTTPGLVCHYHRRPRTNVARDILERLSG
jgi:cyanophycin synthetase